MDTPDRLVYSVPTFLFAIGSPDRLDVNRSPIVPDDDPVTVPARLFARDHGLVLAAQQKFESNLMMFSELIHEVYVRPQDRMLDRTDWPECVELDEFHDAEVAAVAGWARAVMRVSRSSHLGDEPLGGSSGVAGR